MLRQPIFLKKIRPLISAIALCLSSCSSMDPSLSLAPPRHAAVNNGSIEYYRFGSGSPVILIAGYATDVSSWNKDFLATLAKKHTVIVMNNRGVGNTHIHSSSYESKDLASDVNQLMKTLHLRKAAVLGISMGGMIAQQVAVQYPNKVDKLILINTAIAGDNSVAPQPEIEQKLMHLSGNRLQFYNVAVNNFFPAQWKYRMAYSLIADRYLPKHQTAFDPASVLKQQQNLILHWSQDNATAAKIRRLPMQTLILNGKADVILPPANSTILASTIPHATLQQWDDGGHAMIYQYPKELGNAVNAFLD